MTRVLRLGWVARSSADLEQVVALTGVLGLFYPVGRPEGQEPEQEKPGQVADGRKVGGTQ